MANASLKFTQEVKDRWTAALRSGNYEQCARTLKRNAGHDHVEPAYCCLGVLAEINNLEVQSWAGLLVVEPIAAVGVRRTLVEGLSMETQSILSVMNDSNDQDFNQIADWIERSVMVGT